MSDDVLKVFEGLTESQVKELRRRIIQVLPELRREVTEKQSKSIGGKQNEHKDKAKTNREKDGAA